VSRAIEELADDLILLSAGRHDDRVDPPPQMQYGLAGAELIRLVARGQVEIRNDRFAVVDREHTGDQRLDLALGSIGSSQKVKAWITAPRSGIVDAYLEPLVGAATIREEKGRFARLIPVTRRFIEDQERAGIARARLDAVAYGSGEVTVEQAALAGLVFAAGLSKTQYPGPPGHDPRKRLKQLARSQRKSRRGATGLDQATAAAATAATQVSVEAAVSAAVNAAVYSAVEAAVSAAISAGDGASGGDGGGHHGG